jgi:hypothetical protein
LYTRWPPVAVESRREQARSPTCASRTMSRRR